MQGLPHMDADSMRRLTPVLMVALVALHLAACGTSVVDVAATRTEDRSPSDAKADADIKVRLTALYLDQKVGLAKDIGVDVYEGQVLLTGAAATSEERVSAAALAREVEGVRQVINEIQVAPGGGIRQTTSDLAIETKLRGRLIEAAAVKSVNMRWRSVAGTVYLFGRALSEAERKAAVEIARGIAGVRKVVDHLTVEP